MKTLVLAIACIVFLAHVTAAWEPEDEICSKKLNIEKSVIQSYSGKIIQEIDDETYNKYSACYWREMKMLNKDNTIHWKGVKKQLGSVVTNLKEFYAVVDNCETQSIVGKDVGQTVVKNQNCIMKGLFGVS